MKKLLCCPALKLFCCLPLWKTVLFVSSRAFSFSTPTFSLSTPVENSEAAWKKATKCIKFKFELPQLFASSVKRKKTLPNDTRGKSSCLSFQIELLSINVSKLINNFWMLQCLFYISTQLLPTVSLLKLQIKDKPHMTVTTDYEHPMEA